MSYESQSQLLYDPVFIARIGSALNEQAMIYKDDARPEFVRLAEATLEGAGPTGLWLNMITASPGIKDAETQADVTDGNIRSAVQALWPEVAELTAPPA